MFHEDDVSHVSGWMDSDMAASSMTTMDSSQRSESWLFILHCQSSNPDLWLTSSIGVVSGNIYTFNQTIITNERDESVHLFHWHGIGAMSKGNLDDGVAVIVSWALMALFPQVVAVYVAADMDSLLDAADGGSSDVVDEEPAAAGLVLPGCTGLYDAVFTRTTSMHDSCGRRKSSSLPSSFGLPRWYTRLESSNAAAS